MNAKQNNRGQATVLAILGCAMTAAVATALVKPPAGNPDSGAVFMPALDADPQYRESGGGGPWDDPVMAGDCCAAHDETGCEDTNCEALVCGADPFCCKAQWDGICAGLAAEWCAACAPGGGSGGGPGGGPGGCADSCGGQSPDGCWCDEACVSHQDCCPDACEQCGMQACPLDDPSKPCTGDLNGDGVVDVLDLLDLLDAWGACADCGDCRADINGDCIVDVLDLLTLLDVWGECPPASLVYCWFGSGWIVLEVGEDPEDMELLELELGSAFGPTCFTVPPGPYVSGQDIPVTLLEAPFQSVVFADEDEDSHLHVSMHLRDDKPSFGTITDVVADPDGNLESGQLVLHIWPLLYGSVEPMMSGLVTAKPLTMTAGVSSLPDTTAFLVTAPGEVFALRSPLLEEQFPDLTGETGAIVNAGIMLNSPARNFARHECRDDDPPDCKQECPTQGPGGTPAASATHVEQRIRRSQGGAFVGSRYQFKFLPEQKRCVRIAYRVEILDPQTDNGCDLLELVQGTPVLQGRTINAKCFIQTLTIDFTSWVHKTLLNPPCPCKTEFRLTLLCGPKPDGDMTPFYKAQVTWERAGQPPKNPGPDDPLKGQVRVSVQPLNTNSEVAEGAPTIGPWFTPNPPLWTCP